MILMRFEELGLKLRPKVKVKLRSALGILEYCFS